MMRWMWEWSRETSCMREKWWDWEQLGSRMRGSGRGKGSSGIRGGKRRLSGGFREQGIGLIGNV